ncbi:MAG: BrnA antitoxin family protein [Acidobacteriaceae bacterium]|nr:BrnA antitoxin family protein [Acidobacteriaceae bacterium]MBV9779083.1 BrnA antitoxin family protein [Acidobacteriaceae bacterium]
MKHYLKSPKVKEDSKRLRAHLAKHGGEPSPEDLAEIPLLTEEELKQMRRAKEQLTIRLDTDILDWLKSKPGPYQTRLNGILRAVMEHQRRSERPAKAGSRQRRLK